MACALRWVLLGSILVVSPARGQERIKLLEDAALRENWQRVVELAGKETDLSSVERILVGHAELVLNRNNDSLAHFLSVTGSDELTAWRDWASALRGNNPGNAIACYFHGDALARQQEWPAAVSAFSAGLELAPKNALLLNARGVSFGATWDLDRAVVDLDAATKCNPKLADAFMSLGSQWVQRRAGSGAMNALNKAVNLAPDSALARSLRAAVEMVEERFPAARRDVEQALSIAGPLHPAVQARFLDLASLLRDRPAKEVEVALAGGENPGMLINRELQNLQQGKSGSFDRLMSMAQTNPDQRSAISNGIQNAAKASDVGLRSVNAGFSRLSQSDMLAKAVGTNSLTLGPAYAMSIGLSQQSRTSVSQPLASSPQIPDYMYPLINDTGKMSIAAYGKDKELVDSLGHDGWLLRSQLNFPSGLHADVWQRTLSNGNVERVLAFAGTKDLHDFVSADVTQALGGPQMSAEHREALDFLRQQVAEKDLNPRLSLALTGHSLGGSIVQRLSLETGVRAVVFNSAPINNLDSLSAMIDRSGQASVAKNDVWNLRTKGDIVSALPGSQFGRTFTFEASRPTTGQWTGNYATHNVQVLLDSVNATRTGTTGVGSPTRMEPNVSVHSKPAEPTPINQDIPKRPPSVSLPPPGPPRPQPAVLHDPPPPRQQPNLIADRAPTDLGGPKPALPTPDREFTKFFDSLRNSVNQSVGFGSGFNQPKPGGFTAGIPIHYWEDGEWPIRPWYGLGYVVSDRPGEAAREEKQ